jgi:hypothetical protein
MSARWLSVLSARVGLGGLGLRGGGGEVGVAALEGGEDEGVAVREVQVHRGCGDVQVPCHRAQRQGLVVAELVQQAQGGLDDVGAQAVALAARVAAAAPEWFHRAIVGLRSLRYGRSATAVHL